MWLAVEPSERKGGTRKKEKPAKLIPPLGLNGEIDDVKWIKSINNAGSFRNRMNTGGSCRQRDGHEHFKQLNTVHGENVCQFPVFVRRVQKLNNYEEVSGKNCGKTQACAAQESRSKKKIGAWYKDWWWS